MCLHYFVRGLSTPSHTFCPVVGQLLLWTDTEVCRAVSGRRACQWVGSSSLAFSVVFLFYSQEHSGHLGGGAGSVPDEGETKEEKQYNAATEIQRNKFQDKRK